MAFPKKSYIVKGITIPNDLEIKSHFIPKRQYIFSYTLNPPKIVKLSKAESRIIFLRPCDARAIQLLDDIMLEEPYDPKYKESKEQNIFAVVNCLESCEDGFCLSVGGQLINEGFGDLEFTPLKNGEFLVKTLTEKGENFLQKSGARKAKEEEIIEAEKLERKALEEPSQELVKIPKPEDIRKVSMEEWEKIASGCLGCGFCNFSCPTCYCFTEPHVKINDESYSKIRVWDGCLLESFTMMAGGHTIRPKRHQRFHRRYSHKFEIIPEQYDMLGCVGCGRCYQLCPAHFNLKKILTYIADKGA